MKCKQTGRWICALLRDEAGGIGGADYILAVTILAVGGVAGLATVRDAVVQDLGDIAIGLETLSQTYTVNYTFANGATKIFGYIDPPPDMDLEDRPGEAPHGIELCEDQSGGGEN